MKTESKSMAKEMKALDDKATQRQTKMLDKIEALLLKLKKEYRAFEVIQNHFRTFSSKYIRVNNSQVKIVEMQIKKFKDNPSKETSPEPSVVLYITKLRYLDNASDKTYDIISGIEKKAVKCMAKASDIMGDTKQTEKLNDTLEVCCSELNTEIDRFIFHTQKFRTLFDTLKREFSIDYEKHTMGKPATAKAILKS